MGGGTSNRSPIISAGLFVASQTEPVTHLHGARRQELFASRLNVFTPHSFMHKREPASKQTQTERSDRSKERGKNLAERANTKKLRKKRMKNYDAEEEGGS